MTDILRTPGALCTTDLSDTQLKSLKDHGYVWLSAQLQNDHLIFDRDLARIRAAGLSAGSWGVAYRFGDFQRDGFNLGQQAVQQGAEHVQMDVEFAAKKTRPGGMKKIVDGIRAGGWTGPVHLSTLGAPSNPDVNDFEMDVESFLATDGGVLPQAYAHANDAYHPELCVRYWTRMGVPREKLNLTIGLYTSETDQQKPNNRIPGAGWVPLLEQAGVTRNFSIFLAESIQPGDLDGLDALSQAPAPLPPRPSGPTTAQARSLVVDTVRDWRETHGRPEPLARLTIAERVCSDEFTAAWWKRMAPAIRALLDQG